MRSGWMVGKPHLGIISELPVIRELEAKPCPLFISKGMNCSSRRYGQRRDVFRFNVAVHQEALAFPIVRS